MSYVAAVFELLGLYLIGNKNIYGFISFIVGNVFWIYIGYYNKEVRGLMVLCTITLVLNIINFRKWRKQNEKSGM